MDQNHSGANGPKDGSASHKLSAGGKAVKGRAGGSMGAGLAMKIPGRLPPNKTVPVPKKGRPMKNVQNASATTTDLQNGNGTTHLKATREGRKPGKDEKMPNHLSSSLGRKTKSQSSSRNNSASPTNRLDSGDASKKLPPKPVDLSDNEVSSLNLKQLLSIGGNPSRIIYTRIQLLNISENPSSKHRPDCLQKDFNTSNGRWDPETWHRSLSSPPLATSGEKVQKFTVPESRDRFADDPSTGGLILGPQRRSFQDGCHVTSTTASRLSKNHITSPTDTSRHGRPRLVLRQRSEADYESSPAPNRERQIESASAMRSEEFDWERRGDNRFRERDLSDLRPRDRGPRELPRDLHELRNEYGRDHRENDFRDFRERERRYSHTRDFGNSGGWYQSQPRESRERRYSNNEPEPEWYTDGPTSQSETMDLAGFEEETPAAAADFSSWGGEIPMDDIKPNGKQSESKNGEDELEDKKDSTELETTKQAQNFGEVKESEKSEDPGTKDSTAASGKGEETSPDEPKLAELDFNELFGTPGFSAVVEQILKENSGQVLSTGEDKTSTDGLQIGGSASRFSHWFQKDQGLKNETGSGVSTPHEELENLAEVAAERGLASPADLASKITQQPQKPDIVQLLSQGKLPGNLSPSLKTEAIDEQELMRELLRQQMKKGAVMSAAELEAKAGARQSPSHTYSGGVDMQNTDAYNKLVASIKEKDKIRQRQQLLAQQQQVTLGQYQGKPGISFPGGRVPSPDELAAHTQNIFQQALIKRQLERQKEAYSEKIRQIEQQRREEQLREAIRSADAKMQESKQRNKSLAFMPTSVMRKMQESRDGKTDDELMSIQQQQMMPGEVEDIASATASFTAKLANRGKKLSPGDIMSSHNNNLLSRIYQSAGAQQPKSADNPGLRRNASFPEVLMDSNKLGRSSAFHQPMRQNMGASSMDFSKLGISNDADPARLRSLLSMSNEMQSANLLNKPSSKPAMADIYNNNLLKMENHSGKFDRGSPSTDQLNKRSDGADTELKNQQEVARLTHDVLKSFGISEDQLSRLTPQEQQTVVGIVQEQYFQLQAQKQQFRVREKKAKEDSLRLDQSDLSSSLASKIDVQANKNLRKLDQKDLRMPSNAMLPNFAATAQPPGSIRAKYPHQQTPIHGVAPAGLLPAANPHLHPLHLRSLIPPHMQFIPPPMARGAPILPTTFLSPQTHIPGRLMAPAPPNVPLAPPLGTPYSAAALVQMQIYQQQQQRVLFNAIQQQHMAHQQAFAAARQQQLGAAKDSRGDFSNPLDRWFPREVLSQSQLPVMQKPNALTLNDIERGNNQKQD